MKMLAVVALSLVTLLLVACEDGGAEEVARIAFISDRDGNQELYVMNADGSNLKQLTETEGNEQWPGPSWSPDGERIAYVVASGTRGVDFKYEYVVMGADGSDQVTLLETDTVFRSISWSPDSSQLALQLIVDGRRRVVVLDADGEHQTEIDIGDRNALAPTFSPDGDNILIAGDGSSDYRVYLVDSSSHDAEEIARGLFPVWSPDGSRIAVAVTQDGVSDVFVIGNDGTTLINVSQSESQDGVGIAWSPDGDRLAFGSYDLGPGPLDLYAVNADGTGRIALTEQLGSRYGEVDIRWSPDGEQIAVALNLEPGWASDIFVVNADGTGYENITNTPAHNDWLVGWSADSQQLYFQAEHGELVRGGGGAMRARDLALFVIDAGGSGLVMLTDTSEDDFEAALWLPDER